MVYISAAILDMYVYMCARFSGTLFKNHVHSERAVSIDSAGQFFESDTKLKYNVACLLRVIFLATFTTSRAGLYARAKPSGGPRVSINKKKTEGC